MHKKHFGKLILILYFITVKLEGRVHFVKKIQNKLPYDCLNEIFVGIPCYHVVAIFVKQEINYNLLKFNERWSLDFYKGETNPFDPSSIEPPEVNFIDL